MCKKALGTREMENEMLKNLKGYQLFSIELLVESIMIEHGPYKNAGNIDVITETEESEEEEVVQTGGEEGQVPTEGGGAAVPEAKPPPPPPAPVRPVPSTDGEKSGKEKKSGADNTGDGNASDSGDEKKDKRKESRKTSRTKGRSKSQGDGDKKVTDKQRTKSREQRIKQACANYPIDSWKPGVIRSKAFLWDRSRSETSVLEKTQKCQLCQQECNLLNKKQLLRDNKCSCKKDTEYCYKFPIDSIGPKITSKSGISRKKCACEKPKKKARSSSKKVIKKEETTEDEAEEEEEEEDEQKDKKGKKKKEKQEPEVKEAKGKKDAAAKGKKEPPGKGKKEKKRDQSASKIKPEEPEVPPVVKRKRLHGPCPKPPKVEGALPPLRVSVSIFHIRDLKVNQVDLEKLYPPEDNIPLPPEEEQEEVAEIVEPRSSVTVKAKKPSTAKNEEKKKSSSKDIKKTQSKTSSKSSASSKQSKNVVQMKKKPESQVKGVNETELNKALLDLKESQQSEVEGHDDQLTFSKYRDLSGWEGGKCSGDQVEREKVARKSLRVEREKRKQVISALRPITDFRRGLSMVFSATPLEIINKLMIEKMEIIIERCDINGPPLPIGKVKIKLPSIFMDRVQAGARVTTTKPLWTCLENRYPVIDCKGRTVGNLDLYFCLTSLGQGMVSSSLISQYNLYQYMDSARILPPAERGTQEQRATAFRTCYGNLQRLTHKDYNPNTAFKHFLQMQQIMYGQEINSH